MNKQVHNLTFITPCFCAGADQGHAEIRPASIRGELRWWFRVLGGTAEQERAVFGGISRKSKKEDPIASRIVVRVADIQRASGAPHLPNNLRFFTKSRGGNCISPKSTFLLKWLVRAPVQGEKEKQFLQDAWEALIHLGAIGLRTSRGCGAWAPAQDDQLLSVDGLREYCDALPNVDTYFLKGSPVTTAREALEMIEGFFHQFRVHHNYPDGSESALGWAGNTRHASCLRGRPVSVKGGGFIPLLVYTERVLAQSAKSIDAELKEWFAKRSR